MSKEDEIAFDLEGQKQFAELSGDWNPLHVDPLTARRLVFGDLAVHGMHLLMQAVCHAVQNQLIEFSIIGIRAQFLAPVAPGDRVKFVTTTRENRVRIVCRVSGNRKAVFDLTCGAAPYQKEPKIIEGAPPTEKPLDLGLDSLRGISGRLPLHWCSRLGEQRFHVTLPSHLISLFAALAAATRIVGMKCPGLHSVFSELDLELGSEFGQHDEIVYAVEDVDPRFNLVRIGLDVAGGHGRIKAFVRPKPAVQTSMQELGDLLDGREFDGEKALVIGGSRGLGEVVAKLLAAGGATSIITYRSGRDDALRVVNDIRSYGGHAEAHELDAVSISNTLLQWVSSLGPHRLLYMATPRIFGEKGGRFSKEHHDLFEQVYLHGFLDSFYAAHAGGSLRYVLYPSSVAVDGYERQLFEYGIAKAAGEQACRFLSSIYTDIDFRVPRLPRLKTDQTASLTGAAGDDPVPYMLELLRGR